MRTVVGVLRGGPSSEYDVSLKSGAAVLEALDADTYEARDIFISRDGLWHLHGVSVPPERALFGVDVAFNALHGHFGEDGQVQRLLERLNIPYTGSGPLPSATAFNKQHTNASMVAEGILVPHSLLLDTVDASGARIQDIFRTFPQPSIIKPVVGGSGRGIYVARDFVQLEEGIQNAFTHAPQVLVEEYIAGKPASVAVIDNFRNEEVYACVPTSEAILTEEEKKTLENIAKKVHKVLGLRHYSNSDYIVSKRGMYFLEVNSQPKLGKGSVLHEALATVGAKMSHFLDHILQLARSGNTK